MGFFSAIGDVDRDGVDDMATIGLVRISEAVIVIVSGSDGSVLRVLAPQGYVPQAATSAGDMDGDGFGDYAVSGPVKFSTMRRVTVYSGVDDRVIWKFEDLHSLGFAVTIAGGGDVDGDGRPDLLVSAPRAAPFGQTRVYNHVGREGRGIDGSPNLAFGYRFTQSSLAFVGDVDGDGCDDFVVGGADYRTNPFGVGCAVVVSGRTYTVLRVGLEPGPVRFIGDSVAGCGDWDGDGIPDFAAGSWNRQGAALCVFSGRTGARLQYWNSKTVTGFDIDNLECSGIDVDRDGMPDLIVGGPGGAHVLSGRDRDLMYYRFSRGNFGWGLGLPSRQGAGFGEFYIGEPYFGPDSTKDPKYGGRFHKLSGAPQTARLIGQPCGLADLRPRIGMRERVGSPTRPLVPRLIARLTVSGALGGSPAALLLGTSDQWFAGQRLPLSLASIGLPSCRLYTSIDLALPAVTGGAGLDRGYAKFEFPMRLGAQGRQLFAQWVLFDSKATRAIAMSDAITWRALF